MFYTFLTHSRVDGKTATGAAPPGLTTLDVDNVVHLGKNTRLSLADISKDRQIILNFSSGSVVSLNIATGKSLIT